MSWSLVNRGPANTPPGNSFTVRKPRPPVERSGPLRISDVEDGVVHALDGHGSSFVGVHRCGPPDSMQENEEEHPEAGGGMPGSECFITLR